MRLHRKEQGYTILKEGHVCPLPNAGQGTVVQCNECQRYWVKSNGTWLETRLPHLPPWYVTSHYACYG